jgi:hypothetical protein
MQNALVAGGIMNITVAVYDTKPYDRESLLRVEGASTIDWRFLDFRLGPDTAHAASGAQAVCGTAAGCEADKTSSE